MLNKPEIAIKHFSSTLEETPDDVLTLAFLALSYISVDNYEEAKNSCDKAINVAPDMPWGYISHALLSFILRDFYSVLDYGTTAKKLGAETSILFYILALSHRKVGSNSQAQELITCYYDKIQYEKAADPRMHFRNFIEKRHLKYLRINITKKASR